MMEPVPYAGSYRIIMNNIRRDNLKAVADPNRRAIIGLLIDRELTLNQVVANFNKSRPAVSKHIKVPAESGTVEIRREERERYCRARPGRLREISDWLDQY